MCFGGPGWGHLLSKRVRVLPGDRDPYPFPGTIGKKNIYLIVDKQLLLICSVSQLNRYFLIYFQYLVQQESHNIKFNYGIYNILMFTKCNCNTNVLFDNNHGCLMVL